MLFWSPPMNLPLTRLPFFSCKESASAADTTRHITKTNPTFCRRSILFVLYAPGVLSPVHCALPRQRAGIVGGHTGRQFLHLRCPHHGTPGRSTLGLAEHCRGMECARISCFADLSCQLLRSILFWILNFLTGAQFDAIRLFGAIAINQTCKIIRVDRLGRTPARSHSR